MVISLGDDIHGLTSGSISLTLLVLNRSYIEKGYKTLRYDRLEQSIDEKCCKNTENSSIA